MRRLLLLLSVLAAASSAHAATSIRIMPPDGSTLAAGQLVDIRVEATGDGTVAPAGLRVWVDGTEWTGRNDPKAQDGAAAGTTNFLARRFSRSTAGPLVIRATTADGATAESHVRVEAWAGPVRAGRPRARNVILLLGDGMGAAHRTAARLVSRGWRNGKAGGRLAMDTLDVTGMVMTGSLNDVITDSSPGMSSYVTGQKASNNQEGVFPDNTPDQFDNPRIEYLGEILRRTRGPGFNVGIVTTADLTDSTPAANAAHTSSRFAGPGIAAQFFDERRTNGVSVLLGGGAAHFAPKAGGGSRPDARNLVDEFAAAGYRTLRTGADVKAVLDPATPAPKAMLGLFHQSHLVVAFDKVGAGRYSDELSLEKNAAYRDTPMLEDMTRAALKSLSAHSPAGFYLMVEGASIDKRAHAADQERSIWDTIEFDRAVAVALEFAARTNGDANPDNDTLVIVTADHECGGMAIIGVGNERYAPARLGKAVRDYAAVFRFLPEQVLDFSPNYVVDERGFPVDPNPSRKLLLGWAAAPDHHENWTSDRVQTEAAVLEKKDDGRLVSVANPARAKAGEMPGFLVAGTIENGETRCPDPAGCPADTASNGHTFAGHTATDVPLSASGPGAWQFTGVYENTDVLLKILRAAAGTYQAGPGTATRAPGTGRRSATPRAPAAGHRGPGPQEPPVAPGAP
ncbi:alkaline phosphatase [Luteitalea sp. TBR-22]|uniref:alkaline phosphatase n=1 Tax=Luteitalea sp. TBR-22 TaxID=2802971 RepID=UPI001AF783E7|nr:alkaline phosphatase [Luteitalea sp. TBR-22]BCS34787.1 alkaline phosphatase [Luteitalea sp. TBR-22]